MPLHAVILSSNFRDQWSMYLLPSVLVFYMPLYCDQWNVYMREHRYLVRVPVRIVRRSTSPDAEVSTEDTFVGLSLVHAASGIRCLIRRATRLTVTRIPALS